MFAESPQSVFDPANRDPADRLIPNRGIQEVSTGGFVVLNSPRIWMVSFGVWTLVALAASAAIWQFGRSSGTYWTFTSVLGLEFSQILSYAPLTPFALALAVRYPFQRSNWARRSLLYFAVGLMFSAAHVSLRGVTPYDVWNSGHRNWDSAVWDSRTHAFRIRWGMFKTLFYRNVVDDITGTFAPIVIIAHALSYCRSSRERELRAMQLQGQLVKAHLRVLKSQIQPHFLFNTLHSISALMLTDVLAADKMMTRLSDLLRMSLDCGGAEVTTLSWELEFVTGYLEIENLRFQNLKVVFDIAPDTLDAQVPHLLLQPLVENAVRHGIAKISSQGKIRIRARRDSRTLHLRVQNNGPGIDRSMSSGTKGGLGLKATEERLQTLYGNDQHLSIHNRREGGVEVSVRIPFRVHSGAPESQVLTLSPGMSG